MRATREELMQAVEANKIIVILRGLTAEQLLPTVAAMEAGGIRMVEVTFDQSGKISDETTAANIKMLSDTFAGRVHIGAGTVMTTEQVQLAYDAGAEYIISPDTFEEVIKKTRALGMLSMPGAFTPTEAAMAHRYGADYVKLFPNSELGISYVKAIMAPLSHIKFLSVGGVNEKNLAEYLAAGVCGVGVGSAIVDKKAITSGDFEAVTRMARAYTEAAGL